MFAKSKSTFSPSDNQANEKLALYVYEYLMHSGARKAAQTFLQEIQWEKNIFLTDRPGFLFSWWSVFWDLYCAAPERRNGMPHSNEARAFHDFGFINQTYPSGLQQSSGQPSDNHPNGQPMQPYPRAGSGVVSYLAAGPQSQSRSGNGGAEFMVQQSAGSVSQRQPYGLSRFPTPVLQSESKMGMPMFFSNNGVPIQVPASQLEQVYTHGNTGGGQANFYRNIPSLPISSTPSVTLRHPFIPNSQPPLPTAYPLFRSSVRSQPVSRIPSGILNDISMMNAQPNPIKSGLGVSVAFNYGAGQQQQMTINSNNNLVSCNGGGGPSLNSSSSASSFSGSPNNNVEQQQLAAKQKEQHLQAYQSLQRSAQSKSVKNLQPSNSLVGMPSQWVTISQQQQLTKQQQFSNPSYSGARKGNKMMQPVANRSTNSLTPPDLDSFPLLFDSADLDNTAEDDKMFTYYGTTANENNSEGYMMVSVSNDDVLNGVPASANLIFSMPSTVLDNDGFNQFPSLFSESLMQPVSENAGRPTSSQIGQLLSMSPVPPNATLRTPTPSIQNASVYAADLVMQVVSQSSTGSECLQPQSNESRQVDNPCIKVMNSVDDKIMRNRTWSLPFSSEGGETEVSRNFANDNLHLKNSVFQSNDEKTVQNMIDSLREDDLENSGIF